MLKYEILNLIGINDKNVEERLDHFLECISFSNDIEDVLDWLQNIKDKFYPDIIIANAENASSGYGLTKKHAKAVNISPKRLPKSIQNL